VEMGVGVGVDGVRAATGEGEGKRGKDWWS